MKATAEKAKAIKAKLAKFRSDNAPVAKPKLLKPEVIHFQYGRGQAAPCGKEPVTGQKVFAPAGEHDLVTCAACLQALEPVMLRARLHSAVNRLNEAIDKLPTDALRALEPEIEKWVAKHERRPVVTIGKNSFLAHQLKRARLVLDVEKMMKLRLEKGDDALKAVFSFIPVPSYLTPVVKAHNGRVNRPRRSWRQEAAYLVANFYGAPKEWRAHALAADWLAKPKDAAYWEKHLLPLIR